MQLRVKELREEKGWNQTVLGYHAGLSPSQISQIENGKRNPTLDTLQGIATALGVGVGDLFPKAPSRPSPKAPEDQAGGERRSAYPHPWMSGTLDQLIRGWEQSIEGEIDGRRAHAVAIAAIDTLGAVLLIGEPGDTIRDRAPENEVNERSGVAQRLFELSQRAIDRYRASDVFEPDQERRVVERRAEMRLVS